MEMRWLFRVDDATLDIMPLTTHTIRFSETEGDEDDRKGS